MEGDYDCDDAGAIVDADVDFALQAYSESPARCLFLTSLKLRPGHSQPAYQRGAPAQRLASREEASRPKSEEEMMRR